MNCGQDRDLVLVVNKGGDQRSVAMAKVAEAMCHSLGNQPFNNQLATGQVAGPSFVVALPSRLLGVKF